MTTRKSLVFSFLDRYASLAISIGSSMVIARLLTPAEIGVYSVTMVLLMFLASVRDMGAGSYLIQEKHLTNDRIRAVWAVQLGLGLFLALLVLLASHPIAIFYGEPRMRDIMLVVALNYAINPFGSLTYAWLMRAMRFEALAIMRFTSAVAGATTSVTLASLEHGPISLAFGSLAATSANALMAIFYRPANFPWLPGTTGIRRVLSFGSKLSFSNILGVMSGGAPELLLGRFQSLETAGLYSRASGLVQMFRLLVIDAVAAVCLPWFAKQSRERDSIVQPFLKATSYVTLLGWSFCFTLILLAHPLIRLLYGDQWDQSVIIVRLIATATAINVPAALCNIALLSRGNVSKIGRITAFNAFMVISTVFFAAYLNMYAVGLAVIFCTAINTAYMLRVTFKELGLEVRTFFPVLHNSFFIACLAAIGPTVATVIYGLNTNFFLASLLLSAGLGTPLFFLGVFVLDHPIKEEIIGSFKLIKTKIRRRHKI